MAEACELQDGRMYSINVAVTRGALLVDVYAIAEMGVLNKSWKLPLHVVIAQTNAYSSSSFALLHIQNCCST